MNVSLHRVVKLPAWDRRDLRKGGVGRPVFHRATKILVQTKSTRNLYYKTRRANESAWTHQTFKCFGLNQFGSKFGRPQISKREPTSNYERAEVSRARLFWLVLLDTQCCALISFTRISYQVINFINPTTYFRSRCSWFTNNYSTWTKIEVLLKIQKQKSRKKVFFLDSV